METVNAILYEAGYFIYLFLTNWSPCLYPFFHNQCGFYCWRCLKTSSHVSADLLCGFIKFLWHYMYGACAKCINVVYFGVTSLWSVDANTNIPPVSHRLTEL